MTQKLKNKTKEILNFLVKETKIKRYLGLLKKHDEETHKHSLRVAALCIKEGLVNSFSEKNIMLLGYSGLLHDIGKLDVPQKILIGKEKLNDEERKIIHSHPRYGFLKLQKTKFDEIGKIIIAHHEYNKKDSYPRHNVDRRGRSRGGRRNYDDETKKIIQILAAADEYDALIHERPYKKAFLKKDVEKIINDEYTGEKIYLKQLIGK